MAGSERLTQEWALPECNFARSLHGSADVPLRWDSKKKGGGLACQKGWDAL